MATTPPSPPPPPSSRDKPTLRFRFSVVLIVALLGTLSSTALIAATSYLNAKANAESLSAEVLAQAVARVDSRVRSQLDVAVAQSVLSERLLARGSLSSTNQEALARYFIDALSADPRLTYLSFSLDSNGNHVEVNRTEANKLEIRYLVRKPDGALEMSDYRLNATNHFELVRTEPDKPDNEPRPRPFYVSARKARKPVWTETYTFSGSNGQLDSPGLTYATPVIASDGAFVGVLTADFDLRAISRFLKSLDLLDHGFAFIIEHRKDGSRRVVAHPNPEVGLRARTSGNKAQPREALDAEEVDDPRVAAMVRALPKSGGATTSSSQQAAATAPTQTRFTVGETAYIGGYQSLFDGDLRWTVCVVVPEDDVLGPVRRSNRVMTQIIVAGVVVAILVALILGALLSRPLRRLADETEAIGRLELESSTAGRSRLIEIDRLALAMEEMKRGLRSFRKYVPAELVDKLLKTGREAEVGGERRTLSIHFSDIVGFTSIAEKLSPEQLVLFLGDYLEAMTDTIDRSGGTVDKYIGDAIMAFWGAPRADALHALHACNAALENRSQLAKLNSDWEAKGRPRFEARAAVHTGEVVVGNVGSRTKLDYTIIGDAVNLASRLEGLNKVYGTSLMISETTWKLVRDQMIARPLDRVAVKGKQSSVGVYELIGRKETVSDADVRAARLHAEAFEAYLAKEWDKASAKLRENLASRPNDTAALVLLERCTRFAAHPPGADWDGSEKMTTK